MFSRVLVVTLVALPALVSATPAPGRPQITSAVSQCNVGELHCCIHTQQIPDPISAAASGLINTPIDISLGALLGFECTPISVPGVGGNNCVTLPVCCERTALSRLINVLSCSSVDVNL